MDPLTIGMLVVFAGLIFLMFRNNKKRQQQQQELQNQATVGAEVMTTSGIFGTIREIDEQGGSLLIESTPGTLLKVHRQAIAKVVEPVAAVDTPATPPLEDEQGNPRYGRLADEPHEGTGDAAPSDGTSEPPADERK